MQPTESFNIQRRALDVEDYIDILRRHKGWIFGPFLLTLAASVVGIYLWPDSYQSVASVQIRPQQVPEILVQSAVNQDMNQRIVSLTNNILSRTTLISIIRNHDLYKREFLTSPPEDIVENMRRKIEIQPITTGTKVSAFSVRFSYPNRLDAQRVVTDLVGKFMDQNLADRGAETHNTQAFMQDQADTAQKELDAVEQKLVEFRTRNAGHLPDQVESNLRTLSGLQSQASFIQNAISKSGSDITQAETEIRITKEKIAALKKDSSTLPPAVIIPKSPDLLAAEHDVTNIKDQITVLSQKYKDSHPDIKRAKAILAAAIAKRDALAVDDEKTRKDAPPVVPVANVQAQREIQDLNATLERYTTLIDTREKEQASLTKQMKDNNDQISLYTSRIQQIPVGDQEYSQLIREEMMANEAFTKAKSKLALATTAADMEGRKQGEILDLLDAPSLPEKATDPNRGMVISMGAGLGLLLGIVMAGAREMKDTSLKNLKDVRAYTQMAILGSVPLLENDFVVRRRKRMAWLGWTTACLVAAIVMGGSIVYYYTSKT